MLIRLLIINYEQYEQDIGQRELLKITRGLRGAGLSGLPQQAFPPSKDRRTLTSESNLLIVQCNLFKVPQSSNIFQVALMF